MPATITGPGTRDMRELAVKLKAAPPRLRRELRSRLKDAADPVARSVRQSILDMPAPKYPERGLREEVAATIYTTVSLTKTGVRVSIVSGANRMPEGKESLPKHLDSARGWAHPVFPHGERFTMGPSRARRYRFRPEAFRPLVHRGAWTWVRQEGKPQWFERPVIGHYRDLRAAAEAALDDVARYLTR